MIDRMVFAIVAEQEGYTPEEAQALWEQGDVERVARETEAIVREQFIAEDEYEDEVTGETRIGLQIIRETLLVSLHATLRAMKAAG